MSAQAGLRGESMLISIDSFLKVELAYPTKLFRLLAQAASRRQGRFEG